MIQNYLPNRHILASVGRTLLTAQSRWAYVAMAFLNVMIIGGAGLALGGGLQQFVDTAASVLIVNLHIVWIWFALRLLALNTPVAARLVPQYVPRLRVTALWLWASIALATSLLGGAFGGGLLWALLASATLMVFLVAPFRWPLQWSLATFVLVPFLVEHAVFILEEVLPRLQPWASGVIVGCLAVMGTVVRALIHPQGSKLAEFHLRSLQANGKEGKGASIAEPKLSDLGALGQYWLAFAQWVSLPFRLYARLLLSHPRAETRHVLARCELALSATYHWIGQLQLLLGLGLAMGLWLAFKQGSAYLTSAALSPYALLTAGLLMFIAVLPAASTPELLRQTRVEQSLQLLLPGMPRGNALSRKLAQRQLVQAYLAWTVAAVLASGLPFDKSDGPIAFSGYLAVLVLLPIVPTSRWAGLGRLSAFKGLLGLAVLVVVGGGIFAMQYYCHAQPVALLAAACSASLALLNWRWMQVKRHPQAFPAGRQA